MPFCLLSKLMKGTHLTCFTNGETEVQRDPVTPPRSCSWSGAELGLHSSLFDSRVLALLPFTREHGSLMDALPF